MNSSTPRRVISILETLNVQTGTRTELHRFDHLIEAPNWMRGNNTLIYNSRGGIYLYKIAQAKSAPLNTAFATHCNNDHVLAPDHTRIAISHATAEDGMSRVYTMPLAGGVPRLITPLAPSYLHGWSPDGSTLAYCAARNGEYDIYTIPFEGGIEARLTTAPGLNDGPEYSPDGHHIWFNSVRTGLMQLWRMNADGSEQTQITFDEDSNSWFPHVSPDGNHVAYIAYHKGDVEPGDHPANKSVELRLISAHASYERGGGYRTLAKLFGGQGTFNVNSWSPDSSRIAFVRYEVIDD